MPEEKHYTFVIAAHVVGDDGKDMFDAQVSYKNMGYDDVVLVEGALIKMLQGLNEFAELRAKKA